MTVAEAFNEYKSNLEIKEWEEKAASHRHKEIRGVLDKKLDLERHFLTGSYIRDTKTKPLKDVDIFCVLEPTQANLEDFRRKPAEKVLQTLKDILESTYPGRVEVGERSVSVNFGPDEHIMSFDVILAFERRGGGYEIPDSTVAGPWIATDPEIHAELATEKNKACESKWKPLVKMIKGWNRHRKKPMRPSFLLEVIALKVVQPSFTNFAWELQTFFATAAEQITRDWPDPANLGPSVNSSTNLSERLAAAELLKDAAEAVAGARRLQAKSEVAALRAWGELLGPLFPVR